MLDGQIGRYQKRIAEEERLARMALNPELSLAHKQAAMLYRTELTLLRRRSAAAVAETLADIW